MSVSLPFLELSDVLSIGDLVNQLSEAVLLPKGVVAFVDHMLAIIAQFMSAQAMKYAILELAYISKAVPMILHTV